MYPDGRMVEQLNVKTATGIALTAGDKLYLPGRFHPFTIRWIACQVTTTIQAGDQAVIAWEKRVLPGSDANRVTSGVPTITIPGGTAAGKVVYKVVDYLIKPDEEVVVKVTDATAAGAGHILWGIEEHPAHPLNNANMVASA